MIFIGPNDLSLSTLNRVPADWTNETFLGTVQTIVDAARAHGKKTGILAVDGATSKFLVERFGFDFIVLGADVRALQGWYAKELAAAKA
jgi:4-hydroxy-2-oxoheptanedioate aldolase